MRKKTIKTFYAVILAAAALLAVQSCDKKGVDGKVAENKPENASISIIPENPTAGTLLRAVATGGDGLTFRWERNEKALTTTADTLDTAGFKKGDRIKLAAGRGPGAVAETVLLNSPPVVRSVTFKPGAFSAGVDLQAEAEGWDPDGDAVEYEYQWTLNGQAVYSETGPVLGGDRYERGGEISVRVVPYDGEEAGAPFEARAGAALNSPPRFTSVPPVEFSGTFVYKPAVSDKDADAVSISVVKGPEGMTASSGAIEWNAKGRKGSFEVTLAADDGNGGQCLQSFELKVAE